MRLRLNLMRRMRQNQKIRSILCMILMVCVTAGAALPVSAENNVITSPLIFDDENQIFIFESYDKKVSTDSRPCYRTLGFSCVRCLRGNVEEHPELQMFDQYVWFLLDHPDGLATVKSDSKVDKNGYVTTRWLLQADVLKQRIKNKGYDRWVDDLEDDECTEDLYIRLDAIMTTCILYSRIDPLTGEAGPKIRQPEAEIEFYHGQLDKPFVNPYSYTSVGSKKSTIYCVPAVADEINESMDRIRAEGGDIL